MRQPIGRWTQHGLSTASVWLGRDLSTESMPWRADIRSSSMRKHSNDIIDATLGRLRGQAPAIGRAAGSVTLSLFVTFPQAISGHAGWKPQTPKPTDQTRLIFLVAFFERPWRSSMRRRSAPRCWSVPFDPTLAPTDDGGNTHGSRSERSQLPRHRYEAFTGRG